MKTTAEIQPSNPLELEAQADDLEAEALRMRAIAKRLRAAGERGAPVSVSAHAEHVTRAAYALRSNISNATVGRLLAEGMPAIPVGSTVRIDPVAADEWRRSRGRKPTTAGVKVPDIDVDVDLSRAGLRVVGGAR